MWVEFVVGSRPCSERFLSGTFPIRSQHISGRRATLWMIPICLFFCFLYLKLKRTICFECTMEKARSAVTL